MRASQHRRCDCWWLRSIHTGSPLKSAVFQSLVLFFKSISGFSGLLNEQSDDVEVTVFADFVQDCVGSGLGAE